MLDQAPSPARAPRPSRGLIAAALGGVAAVSVAALMTNHDKAAPSVTPGHVRFMPNEAPDGVVRVVVHNDGLKTDQNPTDLANDYAYDRKHREAIIHDTASQMNNGEWQTGVVTIPAQDIQQLPQPAPVDK